MKLPTDEEILSQVDQTLYRNTELQIAHDRMLLCSSPPESEEYKKLWHDYLLAGGNRTMIEQGIDNENWKRLRNLTKLAKM